MLAYASRTGTKRNLAALREAGWRLMVSARGVLRTEGFPYALDNGAWTAFQEFERGEREENFLDLAMFDHAVKLLGAGADWIVLPDIVMGGEVSLALSLRWLRRLRRRRSLAGVRFMLAVQNGMEAGRMLGRIKRALAKGDLGIFVGGDTAWKLETMGFWARLAHAEGTICHVGRVNTVRRIRLCAIADIDSFDGTSASMYSANVPKLDAARRQPDMFPMTQGSTQ